MIQYCVTMQMFGPEGPFVAKSDGSPSAVQQHMERLGLPIVSLKATAVELLYGHPPVTPRDAVIKMLKERNMKELWKCMATVVGAILVAAIIIAWTGLHHFRKPLALDYDSAADSHGSNDLRLTSMAVDEEPRSWLMIRICTILRAVPKRLQDGWIPGVFQKRHGNEPSSDGRSAAGSASVRTLGTPAGSSDNTLKPSKRRQPKDYLTPLWDTDIIHPHSLELATRHDGSVWVLGSGSFGQVIKAIRDGVHDVAVKVSNSNFSREALIKEVEVLRNCRNSNVVQFQGACLVGHNVWLVMEYMPGGDLRSFLARQEKWTWGPRAEVLALDIARGMAYLHSQRVLHLDLKSGNVLLTTDGHAKIADVGIAQLLGESQSHCSNLELKMLPYLAPEVIVKGKANYSADVYSFGVILWELVTGKAPVTGRNLDLRALDGCPERVAQLVAKCLSHNSLDRPTAKEVALQLQTAGKH
eukprot:jgi/Botrbrau1/9747/Bobra.0388s0034.1